MKILTISCSKTGMLLQQTLVDKLNILYEGVELISIVKASRLPEISDKRSLSECVGEYFANVDAIIFLCAAGIAVRTIAPFIRHKSVDPAVLVIDETGKFCIPILSGHAGGANKLAEDIRDLIGATAVITTATDREGKFAVDEFARRNKLVLTDWKYAKDISAGILDGEKLLVQCDIPYEGKVPAELELVDNLDNCEKGVLKMWITSDKVSCAVSKDVLVLVPKNIVVGIGCRKNTSMEAIETAIYRACNEAQIDSKSVCEIASIDLKKEERGLVWLCEKWGVPLKSYSAEELRLVKGDFAASDFVRQVTGVDNVCERSAAMGDAKIILHKKVYDGVTVALSRRKGVVEF